MPLHKTPLNHRPTKAGSISLRSRSAVLLKTGPNLLRTLLVPLLVCTVATLGCKDKDKDLMNSLLGKADKQLTSEPLLAKLPLSTAGFVVMDYSGEGYKLLSQSPYVGSMNAKSSVDALATRLRDLGGGEEIQKILQRAVEFGTQLGVIAPDGKYSYEKVFSRAVIFAGPATNSPLPVDAGLFFSAAKGAVMADKLDILRRQIVESSIAPKDETIAGATKAFSVDTSVAGLGIKTYVAANSDFMGISISKANLEGLFASGKTGALEALQASPEYKQATTPLKAHDNPVTFAFLSLNRMRPLLDAVAKADQSGEFKPEQVPFDAVAAQGNFSKQYTFNFGAAVTPKTEVQTKVFSALQQSALSPAATNIPSDAAFSISLDTRFIGKLEQMIKSIEESAPAGLTEHLKKLDGFTIGLRNNTVGSPLPDLFLILESSAREQLGNFLESSLGMAMSMTGQNSTWQTKDIDGNRTRFFNTLIGAGVYMSAPSNSRSFLIGSSDSIMKDTIAVQTGKSTGAVGALAAPLRTQLTTANIAAFYLNFAKIADVLDSVKNTLAMFTGGNSELNELLQSADLRSWGLAACGVSYTPGVLAIDSSFQAPSR